MMATRDARGRFASTVWEQATRDSSEMQWSAVSSSNVAAVGYNAGDRLLGVTFLNGSSYWYFDVPEGIYETLLGAASVGGTLHQLVKGHYAYERVG